MGILFKSNLVLILSAVFSSNMPLRITPSKGPLPVKKRSSLRNKSYEVEPTPGRKVYPSRGYPQVIRPPTLSDDEAALFNTSRSVLLYNSAQSPPEIAPNISEGKSLVLSDPSHSPPEIARQQSSDNQLFSQLTTSHRSASTSRNVICE